MARIEVIRPILWAQLDKSQVRPRLYPQPGIGTKSAPEDRKFKNFTYTKEFSTSTGRFMPLC